MSTHSSLDPSPLTYIGGMANTATDHTFWPSCTDPNAPQLVVLGTAQDGGVPHIGTDSPAWSEPTLRRLAACLGIIDPLTGQRWLIEATPDLKDQLHRLHRCSQELAAGHRADRPGFLSGVAISHAHIGHYLGLALFGKEMLNAKKVPVHVMPRMKEFLERNLPWCGLTEGGNIELHEMNHAGPVHLNDRISLTPLLVPHRDEHSETVGFRIAGPDRSVLFIPDIDRWEDWDRHGERIEDHLARVDLAYLDSTFFDERELPGRDIGTIPHPTVVSNMERFGALPASERAKIRCIHLNHSNPLLNPDSEELRRLRAAGIDVASEGERFAL